MSKYVYTINKEVWSGQIIFSVAKQLNKKHHDVTHPKKIYNHKT